MNKYAWCTLKTLQFDNELLLIKVSSKSQLLFKFLIFMKFTCVISWVIISMVCSSCILSSRVGRFKCRSWRVASSFTKKYERKMKYVITSQQQLIFIISEWFWHIIQSQRHYLRLFTMIFCPVWYTAVNKKLTFLFDFRHFKLDLLHSIYPATQSEQKIKSTTNPIYTPFWLSFVK